MTDGKRGRGEGQGGGGGGGGGEGRFGGLCVLCRLYKAAKYFVVCHVCFA